ncbi:MAG TPA: hypothetical protein IAC31_03400 [Candidatus Faecousia intestinigallinarum]|nr:hypothetical protein [Candidatus Faecousia intestinigallinarum]
MNESKNLLTSILTTAQMGQTGIRSTLQTPMRSTLRRALETQLREYDAIEQQAQAIAGSRGWELRELEPAAKGMANFMTRMRLSTGSTDSKIAAMMIQGNTKGMITGLKELHQFNKSDPQVTALSQKLLDCETAGIRQMQGFL